MMWRLLASLITFFVFTPLASASVIINEISPRSNPEWIELYNPDSAAVDLTGWYFKDASGTKKLISSSESFLPNTYYLATGYSSWLNNTGAESLYLFDSADTMVDSLSFDETKEDTVVARVPDLSGPWLLDQIPTPLASNTQPSPSPTIMPSPDPSPSPTPTPSPSPLPSTLASAQKPSPSPTILPSLKPTPTPSVTPSTNPSPTPISIIHSPEGTVAGETTIDLTGYGSTSSPSVDPSTPLESSTLSLNKSRAKTLGFIGFGLLLLSLATYLWIRRKNEGIINE